MALLQEPFENFSVPLGNVSKDLRNLCTFLDQKDIVDVWPLRQHLGEVEAQIVKSQRTNEKNLLILQKIVIKKLRAFPIVVRNELKHGRPLNHRSWIARLTTFLR